MIRLLSACLTAAALLAGCSSNKIFEPPFCPRSEPLAATPSSGTGSGSLHRAALAYDRFFQEKLRPRHHAGLVNVRFLNGSTSKAVSYDDQQDSAIWTGTYLAAEAFRYASTRDPEEKREALENARGAAKTLDLYLKVTGSDHVLARFAGPLNETSLYLSGWCSSKCQGVETPDEAGVCCSANDCFPSEPMKDLFWLGGTSRDQYTGWFFGMGIAYRLIDDPDLRQMIREDVRTLITALKQDHWEIKAPDEKGTEGFVEPMEQLAWLLVAADVLGGEGCKDFEQQVKEVWPLLATSVENDFNWLNRYMQYYGFNLAFLNFYQLISLDPNPSRRQVYLDSMMNHTYKYVEGTHNVFFDYIAQAMGGKVPAGTLGQDREALKVFLPGPAPASCVVPPKSEISKVSIDLFRLDRKTFHPQAEKPYPISQWCRQDFLWQQTPYSICCCPVPEGETWPPPEYQEACASLPAPSTGTQTYFPGADYLVAYWMGRYHGYLKPED